MQEWLEIAKLIKWIADWANKRKDADLQEKMVSLNSLVLNIQTRMVELTNDKAVLADKLSEFGKMIYSPPFYYESNDENQEHPCCRNCWESKKAVIHLNGPENTVGGVRLVYHCPICLARHLIGGDEPPQMFVRH